MEKSIKNIEDKIEWSTLHHTFYTYYKVNNLNLNKIAEKLKKYDFTHTIFFSQGKEFIVRDKDYKMKHYSSLEDEFNVFEDFTKSYPSYKLESYTQYMHLHHLMEIEGINNLLEFSHQNQYIRIAFNSIDVSYRKNNCFFVNTYNPVLQIFEDGSVILTFKEYVKNRNNTSYVNLKENHINIHHHNITSVQIDPSSIIEDYLSLFSKSNYIDKKEGKISFNYSNFDLKNLSIEFLDFLKNHIIDKDFSNKHTKYFFNLIYKHTNLNTTKDITNDHMDIFKNFCFHSNVLFGDKEFIKDNIQKTDNTLIYNDSRSNVILITNQHNKGVYLNLGASNIYYTLITNVLYLKLLYQRYFNEFAKKNIFKNSTIVLAKIELIDSFLDNSYKDQKIFRFIKSFAESQGIPIHKNKIENYLHILNIQKSHAFNTTILVSTSLVTAFVGWVSTYGFYKNEIYPKINSFCDFYPGLFAYGGLMVLATFSIITLVTNFTFKNFKR